jgi:hypothetical protein
MPQPIPKWWCDAVVRALKTSDPRVIEWTPPAFQRWHDDTLGGWCSMAYEPITEALSTPGITGIQTTSYADQVATYEFLFRYGSKDMYGKIALKSDRVRILILSAHKRTRSTL